MEGDQLKGWEQGVVKVANLRVREGASRLPGLDFIGFPKKLPRHGIQTRPESNHRNLSRMTSAGAGGAEQVTRCRIL